MKTTLNIDVDFNEAITLAKASIAHIAKHKIDESIRDFFTNKKESYYSQTEYNYVTQTTKGDGLKQIEETIASKFLDEKFQGHINAYFDANWERIFNDCMERALQHKANGIAFNKVHTYPPLNQK